jgi:hypothetical protein
MDRQSVFWGMFIVDRGGGVLNGTGPSLLEEVSVSSFREYQWNSYHMHLFRVAHNDCFTAILGFNRMYDYLV